MTSGTTTITAADGIVSGSTVLTVTANYFTCAINDDGVSVTITGYTGRGGAVAIPSN